MATLMFAIETKQTDKVAHCEKGFCRRRDPFISRKLPLYF